MQETGYLVMSHKADQYRTFTRSIKAVRFTKAE